MAENGKSRLDEIRLAWLLGGRNLEKAMPGDQDNNTAEGELQRREFALQPEDWQQALDHEDQDMDPVLSFAELVWVSRHCGLS